ncbi:MAG: hypothetical protein ACRDIZ_11770 [Actinomycetota bacterium]
MVFLPILAGVVRVEASTPPPRADQDYEITGAEAWNAAQRASFEFHPVLPEGAFVLSGARDGILAELKSCPQAAGSCLPEARVADGTLIVLPPACARDCVREHVFELFAGRPLSSGWTLMAVQLTGTSWEWERAPAYGSRDASFAVRVQATPGRMGRVSLTRIILRGPEGTDWRRAFAETGIPDPSP